nr:hypothetical protein [Gammaproteobacteria bacterium]
MNNEQATTVEAEIIPPKDLEERDLMVTRAQAFEIVSPEDAQLAGSLVRELTEHIKAMRGAAKEHKDRAYATWKGLCRAENEAVAPLEQALAIVQGRLGAWVAEQKRIEQEARIKAERERREREEAERERLAEEALEADDVETAEAILDEPTPVVIEPPVAPAVETKVAGTATREYWGATIHDAYAVAGHFAKERCVSQADLAKALA